MLMILNLLQTLHICCLQPALQEKYYQIHVVQILRTACAQKEKYIAGTMQLNHYNGEQKLPNHMTG